MAPTMAPPPPSPSPFPSITQCDPKKRFGSVAAPKRRERETEQAETEKTSNKLKVQANSSTMAPPPPSPSSFPSITQCKLIVEAVVVAVVVAKIIPHQLFWQLLLVALLALTFSYLNDTKPNSSTIGKAQEGETTEQAETEKTSSELNVQANSSTMAPPPPSPSSFPWITLCKLIVTAVVVALVLIIPHQLFGLLLLAAQIFSYLNDAIPNSSTIGETQEGETEQAKPEKTTVSYQNATKPNSSTIGKTQGRETKQAKTEKTSNKLTVQRPPNLAVTSSGVIRNQVNKPGTSKPNREEAGGRDKDLEAMIITLIVDQSPCVKWDDVAGLEKAKQALSEMVILPTRRRDLFTGLRRPPRGLLLFGPPGNGKTMLAKAVASETQATFFNVSASSLTSKWVGEAEKLVRTLFMIAIEKQPSVIFFDEIDSLMSTRMANEHEASRRLKSEFLVQFDGVSSNPDDLVIVIGATNKPRELDDAVLRRLVKRIYIPFPDKNVRRLALKQKLKGQAFSLSDKDLKKLVAKTNGYSGSDLHALCEAAAMMPVKELGSNILEVEANQVRPLTFVDFKKAMLVVRPSLQKSGCVEGAKWNEEFGSN